MRCAVCSAYDACFAQCAQRMMHALRRVLAYDPCFVQCAPLENKRVLVGIVKVIVFICVLEEEASSSLPSPGLKVNSQTQNKAQ